MKRLAFLLFSLPFLSMAQNQWLQTPEAMRERFVKDISVLASDSLEGRYSGTPGEKSAYEYLISLFREIGLEPRGEGPGSFLQSFPHITAYHDPSKNRLWINGKEFGFRYDFGATNLSSSGSCEGMVSDVGKSCQSHREKEKESGDTSNQNKIVMMDISLLPGCENSTDSTFSLRKPIRMLQSRGAKAVILWNSGPEFPDSLFDFSSRDTLPIPVIYANSAVIREIRSHPRSEARIMVMVSTIRDTYHNVLGYIDNHSEYTVIIGAHYDHMGLSKKHQVRYGADDNASGTAMVIELARCLKEKKDPASNYLFIAFSGEEEGLLGSSWFVSHPTISLPSVNFMINFDMVGRLGCEGMMIYALGTASSPDWKEIFRSVRPGNFKVNRMRGAGAFSDHYGFYKKEIPFAYFTTGFHYDYHTPDGRAEKINYDGMVGIAGYKEKFIEEAEKKGRIRYEKISGWDQFTAMSKYIAEEMDYMLVVGPGGAE
jgi:aminopeptidase YwaD